MSETEGKVHGQPHQIADKLAAMSPLRIDSPRWGNLSDEEVWLRVAVSYAGGPTGTKQAAVSWADHVLAAFRERFRKGE